MTFTRTQVFGFRLMLVIVGAMILVFAIMPGDAAPLRSVSVNDKLGHVLAFYSLALLADFSFPETRFNIWKVSTLLGFGLLIELLQISIPSRTFSLLDLIADAIGLIAYQLSLPGIRRMPLLGKRWRTDLDANSN